MMSPTLSENFAKAFGSGRIATPPQPTITDTPAVEESTQLAIFDVDPELAAEWMTRNQSNRRIRPNRVAQYAADMVAGNWHETGETIKFDTNGDLVDGQHRLSAVVVSGKTVRLAVMFGLAPEARHYVDTGAARTASDALRMKGEPAPAILGATARLAILLERGVNANAPVSHAQVFDYIAAHPELRDASVFVQNTLHKIDLPPSIQAYGKFRFSNVDSEASDQFYDKLANLNDLASDDPILRLAQRLRQMNRNKENPGKRVLAVTLLRTWNHWRQGNAMRRLLLAGPEAPLPDLL